MDSGVKCLYCCSCRYRALEQTSELFIGQINFGSNGPAARSCRAVEIFAGGSGDAATNSDQDFERAPPPSVLPLPYLVEHSSPESKQVEEELFVRTAERLNENAGRNRSPTTTKGTIGAGMELLGVLHRELASAVPFMSTLPPDSAPATMPSVHLVSSPPSDPALPKALHEITEWNQPVTRTYK